MNRTVMSHLENNKNYMNEKVLNHYENESRAFGKNESDYNGSRSPRHGHNNQNQIQTDKVINASKEDKEIENVCGRNSDLPRDKNEAIYEDTEAIYEEIPAYLE